MPSTKQLLSLFRKCNKSENCAECIYRKSRACVVDLNADVYDRLKEYYKKYGELE